MYEINDIVEVEWSTMNTASWFHKAKIVSIEAYPITILTKHIYRIAFEKPYAKRLISIFDSLNKPLYLGETLQKYGYHIVVTESMLRKASVASSADYKAQGLCLECGHKGEWRALALICPVHGKFAG